MKPIIVIHDTGADLRSTLRQMQSSSSGISYHVVIGLDGSIYYVVPPHEKAYGAARSSFKGESIDGSVDDFAYHVALETGTYTDAQYLSLAYVIARTGIEDERITTHAEVDTSGLFKDPESIDMSRVFSSLKKFSRTAVIDMGVKDD